MPQIQPYRSSTTASNITLSNAVEIPSMRQNVSYNPCRIPFCLGQSLILRDIVSPRCYTNRGRDVIFRANVHVTHHLQRQARHGIIGVSETVVVAMCGGLVGDVLRCCYIADARLAECSLDLLLGT